MINDQEDVASGCIGVCSTLFDPVCKGCGRTQADVDNWVWMSRDEKLAAVQKAEQAGTAMRFQKPPF
jgi:predicted Fe-S protein YdhL (DUF1289 family)